MQADVLVGRLGRLLASAAFVAGGAAHAQCVNTPNPPPTTPSTYSFANQSFNNPPPYSLFNEGDDGCAGASRGFDDNGDPGSPGQASGGITSTASNVTITGSGVFSPSGALVTSGGGTGGDGGNGGNPAFRSTTGGDGGAGGGGGPAVVNFSGQIAPAGTARAARGFLVFSVGGGGGNGGSTGTFGTYDKTGGDGGEGGAGGSVQFSGSGGANANVTAIVAQSQGGGGGNGGSVGTSDLLVTTFGGQAGNGGAGGSASLVWSGGAVSAGQQGLLAWSAGGSGGAGGSAKDGNTNYGGNGGTGGSAGAASLTLAGGSVTVTETAFDSYNAGVIALSEAGNGGAGGRSGGANGAEAGNGGTGGAAGAASATVNGNVSLAGLGLGPGHAVLVLSAGGQGGAGGNASAGQGNAGGGGLAGAAGAASLSIGTAALAPAINGTGKYANAAVVQSIGGGGGQGGNASFFADSGAGAPGGDAGTVTATITNGVLLTSGAAASGLIAQSIGGGGGIGGDASSVDVGAGVAIGGNGGLGGNGAGVTVTIGQDAIIGSTSVLGDNGVLAQSVGGSGGAGGSAVAKGSGLLALTIGGDAGGGGAAGAVSLTSAGLVTSYGDHAAGLHAQSIGGGGGKGGAAVSFDVGVVPTLSVAIGGRGGSGGPADTASAANSGQVTTYGSDAWGVVAQSVGGGGGSGGAAAARAVSIAPSESFPAVSVSVALGGAGGSGNTGAAATASNSGFVLTAGEGAYALAAQSVGGGGGLGGDATAASYSGGNSPGLTVSFSLAVGGSGGTGATAGTATANNDQGLLLTYGADAYGLFAQSVGGGGGAGGTGDASATASKAPGSFAAALAIGGTGGTGGHGGGVSGTSSGGINTNGDGADGMFVQSVGGGGGAGGGGIGAANGGNLTISVGLGGSGGAGGNGGTVTAANSGAIVTRGTDAVGLLAQSVGGGGGKGGKAGATSGGVNPVSNATKLFDTLAGGLNLGASITKPVDGIFKIAKLGYEAYSAANELYAVAQQLAGGPYQVGEAVKIGIGISVGGQGGAAGNGGDVTATNSGQISNFGAQSDGIFAQSIGGGGGKGGAATSTDTATNDTKTQLAIGGGGAGGAGGDGGSVSVLNDAGALVQTQGVLGFGIFAQSVGGGGGSGGVAGTISGSLVSLSVGIGGDGGSQGAGGAVKVSNTGTVTTSGKHGIGIFAQSIGGGGGLARSMTTNETFNPADIGQNPQGRFGDIHGLTLSFNGTTNTTGDAGTAEVDVAGTVTTSGRTAHAILAQSIGGGGGAAIGGLVLAGDTKTGTGNGSGDTVTISTTAGAVISTAGDGAYGILAQSIGGGGGLGGSLADVSGVAALAGGTTVVNKGTGNGGAVGITLTGARLTTAGKLAPAVYAQSLGGGGGLIGQGSTLFSGGAGGSGSGSTISVTLVNTSITATGIQSPGLALQANGSGGAVVSIDAQSSVTGGAINEPAQTTLAGAIWIQQGNGNSITNAGTITGAGNLNPTAILSDAAVKIDNSGTISGAVVTGGNGSVFTNAAGGVFNPGATVALGSGGRLDNRGTLVIGGAGVIGATRLTGDLASAGRIIFDADFAGGRGDTLLVSGTARLADSIVIAPLRMRNARLPLVSAAGGLSVAPGLAVLPAANRLFSYRFDSDGTTLYATPQARFAAEASGLAGPQRAIAGHLQSLFDSGELFDDGFTALSNLATPGDFAASLGSMTGDTLGAAAVQRYQSSRRLAADVAEGCDSSGSGHCLWARGLAGQTTADPQPGSAGYVTQFQAIELGAEVALSEGLALAGAVGYEHSALRNSADTGRINGDSLLLALGLSYRSGGLEIIGSLDGGYGWYDSQRQIRVGGDTRLATAAPGLWTLGVGLAASWRLPLGGEAWLKPFAAVRGTNVASNAFVEASSSAFALDVLGESRFAVAGGMGAALGTSLALGPATRLKPFVLAAVEFAGDTGWTAAARFAGESGATDAFAIATPAPGTFGRFGLGAELAGTTVSFSLSYTPEVGSGYVTQQGVARLTWRF